jgi:hypothetical protein
VREQLFVSWQYTFPVLEDEFEVVPVLDELEDCLTLEELALEEELAPMAELEDWA